MLKLRFTLNTLLVLVLTVTFASLAQATTPPQLTYVSSFGYDGASCSRSNPCRHLQTAVDKVAPGGVVNVLEAGEYGKVTITKSVTIDGTVEFAVISPKAGEDAITITAGAADVVVLRELKLVSVPAHTARTGIQFTSGQAVHVEGCQIDGSAENGINAPVTTPGAPQSGPGINLYVKDTISRDNGKAGIFTQVAANLDHVRVENNVGSGFVSQDNAADVRDSVASGNQGKDISFSGSPIGGGFVSRAVNNFSVLTLEHCTASFNAIGVSAVGASLSGSQVRLVRNIVQHNTIGLSGSLSANITGTVPGTNLIFDNGSGDGPILGTTLQ